jgi:hypothetical protein
MPDTTSPRPSDGLEVDPRRVGPAQGQVAARVHGAREGLAVLLAEAEEARRSRAESTGGDGGSAVCAWNHFENIPTFYNWNNRPR